MVPELPHVVLEQDIANLGLQSALQFVAGIRVGELLELRVGDLEIGERSGKLTVRRGKRESYREIPLTLDVRGVFSQSSSERPERLQRSEASPRCSASSFSRPVCPRVFSSIYTF